MKPASILLEMIIRAGTVVVIDAEGVHHSFEGRNPPPKGAPHTVTMRIHDRRFYWRFITNPSLAIGEAFMNGTLTPDEGTSLYDLLLVLMENYSVARTRGLIGLIDTATRALCRILAFNPVGRSQRNVAHHYDLGDELFDLFLDSDRQYSCAYFADPSESLEQAQMNKKNRIARKLLLRPGARVLDIGSGWGGLSLFLAKAFDADVTGITLSREQLATSNARAGADHVNEQCRFLLRDYRHERGQYDRVVSIGMFEHVGLRHYRAFFRHVSNLLADNGIALIHSIGMFDRPGPVPAWISKYIFPGSYIPTLSQALLAVEAASLKVTDIEIWRIHYAETLQRWRTRFLSNRDKAKAMYDERFCRMWEFYLTSCEIAFRIGDLMVFQLQLTKDQEAVPLTRDYIGPARAPITDAANVVPFRSADSI